MAEWGRHTLEVLRQPLESGVVTVSRAARQSDFPARFQLVAATKHSTTRMYFECRKTAVRHWEYAQPYSEADRIRGAATIWAGESRAAAGRVSRVLQLGSLARRVIPNEHEGKRMEFWARRQRDTNRMARIMAKHILRKPYPTADHLYALSKLSWITESYDGTDAAYISSTKIPALGELLGKDYQRNTPLEVVAEDAKKEVGGDEVSRLILGHSGFTNFYKAYRNSVRVWLHDHHAQVLPLFRASLEAQSDSDRLHLVDAIVTMPGIPKANHPEQTMRPEFFLTPVFFMLDPEIKFPIINGNKWVQALLSKLQVDGTGLTSQYKAMVQLYGHRGVVDAADLDQLGRDLPDFLDSPGRKATKQLLQPRGNNERDLALKDESDYMAAREATTVAHKKIHNRLTNDLRECLGQRLTILEGINDCKFDAVVKRYNGEDDLLVEAKSSPELPHLRMAVGQLLNYWYQLHADKEPHLAVLVPTRPLSSEIRFLEWMDVGILWFEGKTIKTCTPWLADIADITESTK